MTYPKNPAVHRSRDLSTELTTVETKELQLKLPHPLAIVHALKGCFIDGKERKQACLLAVPATQLLVTDVCLTEFHFRALAGSPSGHHSLKSDSFPFKALLHPFDICGFLIPPTQPELLFQSLGKPPSSAELLHGIRDCSSPWDPQHQGCCFCSCHKSLSAFTFTRGCFSSGSTAAHTLPQGTPHSSVYECHHKQLLNTQTAFH